MGEKNTSGRTGDPGKGTGGGLNRRQVIKGAGAAGVTAAALPGLLGGHGAFGAGSASAADYDPMKYAGTEINILMTGDENDHRALDDLLPEMKAETGNQLGGLGAGPRPVDREDAAKTSRPSSRRSS